MGSKVTNTGAFNQSGCGAREIGSNIVLINDLDRTAKKAKQHMRNMVVRKQNDKLKNKMRFEEQHNIIREI